MSEVKHKVDFEPLGKRVEVKPGMTILDAARQAGLPLTSECGGAGSCGQCKVIVREQKSSVSSPNLTEQIMLEDAELIAGVRLACQADVLGNVKVDLPAASLVSEQRLQLDSALHAPAAPGRFEDLVIQPFLLSIPPATLHDLRSDLHRVLDILAVEHNRPGLSSAPVAVQALSPLLRNHDWQVTALVRGKQVIGFLAPGVRPVGLAVDLGTTKIAAYLVDLASGKVLAAEGQPNPQIGYGEDVISRLAYVESRPDGGPTLAGAVHSVLRDLAQTLVERVGVSTRDIAEVCVVGNTAMTHLLLQLPTGQLALSPYVPAAATELEVRASDLGLAFASDSRVYIPPCVAGFVGADLVAMTLASGIGQDERNVLGIDIGTNTEIVLSVHGRQQLIALSCASGPAFEGAHIRSGMRAAAGAIERVRLDENEPFIQTIGNVPPVGICGSGIIDVVAELRRVGAINARGRFQSEAPRVQRGKDGLEYLLVPSAETSSGEEIAITQHDVSEIQLAKAAIMAGITVLLQVGGLQPEDLDEIIIAGAFGAYLNLDTAISAGLLPDLPVDRYRQVGNAAGEGARRILFSTSERQRALEIARKIDYVELSIYPGFQRIYARAMQFQE